MIFQYECLDCEHKSQHNFPIGKALKKLACPKCFKGMAVKLIGKPSFTMNTQFKDSSGTPIWCPTGGYFDRALNKPFKSARDKREYMKKKELVMDGSLTPDKTFKKHERSGDFKTKAGRQAAQMED